MWVRRDRAGAQSEAKQVQKALGWAGEEAQAVGLEVGSSSISGVRVGVGEGKDVSRSLLKVFPEINDKGKGIFPLQRVKEYKASMRTSLWAGRGGGVCKESGKKS